MCVPNDVMATCARSLQHATVHGAAKKSVLRPVMRSEGSVLLEEVLALVLSSATWLAPPLLLAVWRSRPSGSAPGTASA